MAIVAGRRAMQYCNPLVLYGVEVQRAKFSATDYCAAVFPAYTKPRDSFVSGTAMRGVALLAGRRLSQFGYAKADTLNFHDASPNQPGSRLITVCGCGVNFFRAKYGIFYRANNAFLMK
ncbi:hypothetical protein [Escherichia coli]|uniref:hypothetical protein n=1 Tax=Escherichia coli TaxID=562 RepID=UPI00187C5065|nr:hypothetical protein [Escherichia coli]